MIIKTTEEIVLHPNELYNVKKSIKNKLEQKIYKCTKEYGYIQSIVQILSYKTNIISRTNGHCCFTVTYTMDTLKPEIYNIYKCQIEILSQHGIISQFNGIKELVPQDAVKDWHFNANKKKYIHKILDKSMYVGEWITVKLIKIRFDKNIFQCIGEIV